MNIDDFEKKHFPKKFIEGIDSHMLFLSQEAARGEHAPKENTVTHIRDITGTCPSCNADWRDKPIPEENRHHYAPLDADPSTYPTHFSRLIAMEDRDIYDGAHSYKCPDCEAVFPRILRYHAIWHKRKMGLA